MKSGIAMSGKLVAPACRRERPFGRLATPWVAMIAHVAAMASATAIGTLMSTSQHAHQDDGAGHITSSPEATCRAAPRRDLGEHEYLPDDEEDRAHRITELLCAAVNRGSETMLSVARFPAPEADPCEQHEERRVQSCAKTVGGDPRAARQHPHQLGHPHVRMFQHGERRRSTSPRRGGRRDLVIPGEGCPE